MKEKNIFVIRYRWHIIIATLLIVGLSIIPILNISINPDLESYMPDTMSAKKQSQLIKDEFGDDEPLMILIEAEDVLQSATLQRIQNLSEAFTIEPGFKRVFSLFQTKIFVPKKE